MTNYSDACVRLTTASRGDTDTVTVSRNDLVLVLDLLSTVTIPIGKPDMTRAEFVEHMVNQGHDRDQVDKAMASRGILNDHDMKQVCASEWTFGLAENIVRQTLAGA